MNLRLSGCDITSGGCDLAALLRDLKEPLEAGEFRIKIKARAPDPAGGRPAGPLWTAARCAQPALRAARCTFTTPPPTPIKQDPDFKPVAKRILEEFKAFVDGGALPR